MSIKEIVIAAESVEYGPANLEIGSEVVSYKKEYRLLDAQGEHVPELQSFSEVVGSVNWESIPEEIKTALVIIDSFINDQIAQQEGLSEG